MISRPRSKSLLQSVETAPFLSDIIMQLAKMLLHAAAAAAAVVEDDAAAAAAAAAAGSIQTSDFIYFQCKPR